ncbi:MAG: hypothetical protein DRP59_00355 [Spirochaetes bacterium]|nr:MAG: hypothetical protein DRP59_00355 [Spirochaetota bacterium]
MEEYRAALEFLKTLLTEQRLLDKKRSQKKEEIETWRKRITLAEEKILELEKDKMDLDTEAQDLGEQIKKGKADLARLEKTRNVRVDPQQILEKIERLSGEKAEDLLLEAELEKLKKEMEG